MTNKSNIMEALDCNNDSKSTSVHKLMYIMV